MCCANRTFTAFSDERKNNPVQRVNPILESFKQFEASLVRPYHWLQIQYISTSRCDYSGTVWDLKIVWVCNDTGMSIGASSVPHIADNSHPESCRGMLRWYSTISPASSVQRISLEKHREAPHIIVPSVHTMKDNPENKNQSRIHALIRHQPLHKDLKLWSAVQNFYWSLYLFWGLAIVTVAFQTNFVYSQQYLRSVILFQRKK